MAVHTSFNIISVVMWGQSERQRRDRLLAMYCKFSSTSFEHTAVIARSYLTQSTRSRGMQQQRTQVGMPPIVEMLKREIDKGAVRCYNLRPWSQQHDPSSRVTTCVMMLYCAVVPVRAAVLCFENRSRFSPSWSFAVAGEVSAIGN